MITGRLRVHSLGRLAIGVVVALCGLMLAISPASAAASTDGTSNTIQFAIASAALDQAHHRVVITAPTEGGLVAGRHLGTAEVVTPKLTYILQNTMVSGFAGTPSESLSLNFTQVNIHSTADAAGPACSPGVDACLIEEDGTYPPAL